MIPFRPAFLVLLSLVAILLAGCATPKHFSNEFGQAFTQTFHAQVMNPDAPVNRAPVTTMPGTLANAIYKNKYEHPMKEVDSDSDAKDSDADIMAD
ncbi:hypothetical protein [Desulfoluna spongiiphila]|uniref:Lipoprotein n=1 Tax=Desulfoluna spongiiphila TaxID=419481 RepID=A0A1G5HE60_9BACT|nr:hypothetical protein [Desulfoluna spongiiphila]SCY61789.1 hypothetical protein SAMN05216233_113116 [Desulfoluna spongiiphila]